MSGQEKKNQYEQEPDPPDSELLHITSNSTDEEVHSTELARRLAKLDFSPESKIRERLRERLQYRSRWLHSWVRGFSYWAGFAVVMLFAMIWVFDFQLPKTNIGVESQASAYANTGSFSSYSNHGIASTLPARPKPIPTPQALLLPDHQPLDISPSLTISPPTTPSFEQKTDFH